jgi:rifampicin phosphotransferase
MYTCLLDGNLTESTAGAKAFQLGSLKQAKYPVPDGFVITSNAFDEFFKNNNVITEEFLTELKAALNNINAVRYMVRSSAIGEDGHAASFAGQLESFQSGPDFDEILSSIRKCWSSYQKDNVTAYEKSKQIRLNGMAVIVQKLIDPDHAGVIFTRNPENESELLVEFVNGHAEQLVSGKVNPQRFTYDLDGKNIKTLPINFKDGIDIAMDLERHYHMPLDIEWAMKDNAFYVVQARPITTAGRSRKVYWSNTNVNENYPDPVTPLLYSIARDAYYNYFRELSTLFLIDREKVRALEASYGNVIGIFGCRIYYNMTSIHEIIRSSPFASMLLKAFDNFVGYTEGAQADPVPTGSNINFLMKVIKFQLSLSSTVQDFEKLVDHYRMRCDTALSFAELRECFHGFIEIRMRSWYKASLADFFAMLYHGALGRLCKKFYTSDADGIHNKLIQAIPGLVSTHPIIAMHSIRIALREDNVAYGHFKALSAKEFYRWLSQTDDHKVVRGKIEAYIAEWGFRCSGELMLTTTTYCEAPEEFIELLRQYDQMPLKDPELLIKSKFDERKKAIRRFRNKILAHNGILFPVSLFQIGLLHLLIGLASTGIKARERVRLKQALLYFKFKQLTERIGRAFQQRALIGHPADILFLRYQEIAENLTSSDMLSHNLKERIALSRLEFERASKVKYPDDFATHLGECTKPATLNGYVPVVSGKILKGLPVCGGQIRGRARVLASVLEAGKLETGDILVTRQTDPGWTVVFPLISGLIVERGGMLSHGAIVSREFGIPAVVGVENAHQLIKDGEEVYLNADSGEISIL